MPPDKANPPQGDTYDPTHVPHIPPDIINDTPHDSPLSSLTPSDTIDTCNGDDESDNSDDDGDDSNDSHDSASTHTTLVKRLGPPKLIKHVVQNVLSAVSHEEFEDLQKKVTKQRGMYTDLQNVITNQSKTYRSEKGKLTLTYNRLTMRLNTIGK